MFDRIIHKWLRIPYSLHVHTNRRVKKPQATIVLLHGIGNSGAAWHKVVDGLPKDAHVISIDLLGFGKSPRPLWALYNAKTQARSVLATLLKLRLRSPIILVGHSMGSLVAIEITRRLPLIVSSLILISPPLYRYDELVRPSLPRGDHLLRELYRLIKRHPEEFVQITALAVQLKLFRQRPKFTPDEITVYMNALEASIINQTSFHDISTLRATPIHILYGRFDPVVIANNLRHLAATNPAIRLTPVLASHEIRGAFVPATIRAINDAIKNRAPTSRKSPTATHI